jgi:Methylamine utilisation protein MauE
MIELPVTCQKAGVRRARNALQYLIASVLFATAAGKLLDVPGFVGILAAYRAFPPAALYPLAAVVIAVEMALAGWLLSGQRLARAAGACTALDLLYAVWSAISILRGLHLTNYGGFGVFLPLPLDWSIVVGDLVMAALSAALWALVQNRLKCRTLGLDTGESLSAPHTAGERKGGP